MYLYGSDSGEDGNFAIYVRGSNPNSLKSANNRLSWGSSSLCTYSDVACVLASQGAILTLPAGGTWKYFAISVGGDNKVDFCSVGEGAGGTKLHTTTSSGLARAICFRA